MGLGERRVQVYGFGCISNQLCGEEWFLRRVKYALRMYHRHQSCISFHQYLRRYATAGAVSACTPYQVVKWIDIICSFSLRSAY